MCTQDFFWQFTCKYPHQIYLNNLCIERLIVWDSDFPNILASPQALAIVPASFLPKCNITSWIRYCFQTHLPEPLFSFSLQLNFFQSPVRYLLLLKMAPLWLSQAHWVVPTYSSDVTWGFFQLGIGQQCVHQMECHQMEPGPQILPLLFALVNSTVIDSEIHVKLQAGLI